MKAIGYQQSLAVTEPDALVQFEAPTPTASGRDILVKVEAVSVNPVDTKVRRGVQPENNEYKILGWDAAGTVIEVGDQVSLFKPGDKVWYAGAIDRAGSNAEYQLVDERIVAKMPASLGFKEAAAMPLTTITAWEILFDRFNLTTESKGTLLIMGGAGGVGSMMIQLAKQLTQLTVIATASRDETRDWVKSLGADYIINHHQPLTSQLIAIGIGIDNVNYIAGLTHTGEHLEAFTDIIAPQGKLAVIDDPQVLDIMPFKRKSVSIHWEFMYTRSLFQTDDILEQHKLLTKVASMVDDGKIKSTLQSDLGEINAENLIKAHTLIESDTSIGKVVLGGF